MTRVGDIPNCAREQWWHPKCHVKLADKDYAFTATIFPTASQTDLVPLAGYLLDQAACAGCLDAPCFRCEC